MLKTDREELIVSSGRHFICYILGRYFCAPSSFEQLQWLLGEDFKVPSFTNFDNSPKNIFPQSLFHDFSQFKEIAKAKLTNFQMGVESNGVIAALLLFNTNSRLKKKLVSTEYGTVGSELNKAIAKSPMYHQIIADENSKEGDEDFKIIDYLQEMSQIMIQNDLKPKENDALDSFDQACQAVSMGEEWLKEFVMFSYDVPLSKHFAARSFTTFMERYRKVLQTHEQYRKLSLEDQVSSYFGHSKIIVIDNPGLIATFQDNVWKLGSMKAATLCTAKAESLSTGKDQLDFFFGDADMLSWHKNYESNMAKSHQIVKLKKVSLVDCNRVSHLFNAKEIFDYLHLSVHLGELTSERDVFKTMALLSLFSQSEDRLSPAAAQFVAEMKGKYLSLLGIKSEKMEEKIQQGLKEIDDLAKILSKLTVSM